VNLIFLGTEKQLQIFQLNSWRGNIVEHI